MYIKIFQVCKKQYKFWKSVIQVDFAENYTCLYQDEIQSAHWSNPQVTVFTAAIWHNTDHVTSYAVISDNITHDRFSVKAFLHKILTVHLKENESVKSVCIFSDGCAGQFKQKYNFANMTSIKSLFNLHKCTWTFFATAHGKGAVDGIGAVTKWFVRNEVRAKRASVRNANDFVKIVYGKTKVNILYVSDEDIKKCSEIVSSLWQNLASIKGSQKILFVEAKNDATIQYRPYPQHNSYNEFRFHKSNPTKNVNDNAENANAFNSIDAEKLHRGQWVVVR